MKLFYNPDTPEESVPPLPTRLLPSTDTNLFSPFSPGLWFISYEPPMFRPADPETEKSVINSAAVHPSGERRGLTVLPHRMFFGTHATTEVPEITP